MSHIPFTPFMLLMWNRSIVREIDEIRAGLWDDRIRQSLGAEPPVSTAEEHPVPAEDEPIITEPVSSIVVLCYDSF